MHRVGLLGASTEPLSVGHGRGRPPARGAGLPEPGGRPRRTARPTGGGCAGRGGRRPAGDVGHAQRGRNRAVAAVRPVDAARLRHLARRGSARRAARAGPQALPDLPDLAPLLPRRVGAAARAAFLWHLAPLRAGRSEPELLPARHGGPAHWRRPHPPVHERRTGIPAGPAGLHRPARGKPGERRLVDRGWPFPHRQAPPAAVRSSALRGGRGGGGRCARSHVSCRCRSSTTSCRRTRSRR